MSKSRRLAQHVPARTAWPTLEVLEPMSGDFGVVQPPTFPDYIEHEPEFNQLYQDALHHGKYDENAWKCWATKCRIPTVPWLEKSAVVVAQRLIALEDLSNICEDYVPHIGLFIDDLLWAGEHHRDLSRLGGAIASTLPLLKHGHTPLYKISNQQPKLRTDLHQSLTAHFRTPTMLWQKTNDGVKALLPIGQQYIPNHVSNLDAIESEVFVAKILYIDDGTGKQTWKAHFVLPVPSELNVLLPRFLTTRLQIAWYRYRRHNHKICFEDILRERADILYRSVFELH